MRAYMEQTVMCKGQTVSHRKIGNSDHYSNFNPEAYILLKLVPTRQENAWYRRTQEQSSSNSEELMQAEKEFFSLSIGYRSDMAFKELKSLMCQNSLPAKSSATRN